MSTTEPNAGDDSTATKYTFTLKPKYQHQADRTKWIEADSVEVWSGPVIFRDADGKVQRIFDADDIIDVRS